MTEDRLRVIARIMVAITHTMSEFGDSYEDQIEAVQDRLRVAIKESSEEKDEVIRRLANESTSYRLNIAHRPVS